MVEETVQKETLYRGKVIDLELHDVTLPDGNDAKREIVRHPGAVGIITIDNDGRIILVKQYRKALGKVIYEIPAGKKEPGEDSLTTAKRELEEETGYQAEQWKEVTSFYTSPGFADEIIELYEARDIQESHQLSLDEDEFIEVIAVTLEEAKALLHQQLIHDAKTAYALLYLDIQAQQS
ncbi:NUDIX hydrolase [Bacillaceae bacterium SIJ1]|uniref:NUDIX hydrolase n=1 Tax=Litoribacterium kuwaitense TaxID=1398745 RepID=UPI0013EDB3C1|nr:NUDIX hydrolase [Litoribacterium kuwaitense]NGP43640.1 NUDIX hydrolase [Litoribacterium kuwaitense]